MMVIPWFLFLFAFAEAARLGKIWELKDLSVSERVMRTISESCFKNHTFPNPVLTIGDFNEISDKVPVIRISDFRSVRHYVKYEPLQFKASNIVLMEGLPIVLRSNLILIKKTKLWDHMIPFFIIGDDTTSCENSKNILTTMWKMEIVNAIYICAQSINNTSVLYTLNPIANYAPYPWKRVEELVDLNIFQQYFDENISCKDLTYDKTKVLNGYPITAVTWGHSQDNWEPGRNYFDKLAGNQNLDYKVLRSIIIALNASGRFEVESGTDKMKGRFAKKKTDTIIWANTFDSFKNARSLFPHKRGEMVAVVKLKAEVSTLQKIYSLRSTQVLILAAVVLSILFLILIIKNRDFGLALLDITRLLIYTSIRTDTRYQSFRIYFTTMLIFMVISNGVFQGKIAAFLTTRERGKAVKSIDDLIKLKYEMYAPFDTAAFANRTCPKCVFKEVASADCINLVLNGTNRVCAFDKLHYEALYILLPLDHVEEILYADFENLKCRENWPLHDRVNNMIMMLVESGLPYYWEDKFAIVPRAKRQAMEAEWSSPEYRPVMLPKLKFAFQLLVVGLSLASIVLLLEVWWAKLCNS